MSYSDSTEYSQVKACPVRMTAKAVLIKLEEDDREVWVPMSVIFEDDIVEMEPGVYMEFNIASWFCRKEGL